MSRFLKVIAVLLFLAPQAFAFTAPIISGLGTINNNYSISLYTNPPSSQYIYSARMAPPRFYPNNTTGVAAKPWPTDKWFSHTYILSDGFDPNNGTYWNFPFSMQMSPSPMILAFHTSMWAFNSAPDKCEGYLLGAPSITYLLPIGGVGDGLWTGPITNNGTTSAQLLGNYALWIQGFYGGTRIGVSNAVGTMLKNYSDWAATVVLQDQTNPAYSITTTFGKGFLFTYNTFSAGVTSSRITSMSPTGPVTASGQYNFSLYDANGNAIGVGGYFSGDRAMIKYTSSSGQIEYYGIYAPPGTNFGLTTSYQIDITFANSAIANYMSVSLLRYDTTDNFSNARSLFDEYYQYAYNFVSESGGTQADFNNINGGNVDIAHSQVTTNFQFHFTPQRTGAPFISNQTIFAVYPHQWKYMNASFEPQTYQTLRGTMKVLTGNSFQVTYNFAGMLPFLTYEIGAQDTAQMAGYMYNDNGFTFNGPLAPLLNIYRRGKYVSKAANLIPIFQQAGIPTYRDSMLSKLKTELVNFYTYTPGESDITGKFFGYDTTWGGLIGAPWWDGVNGSGSDSFGLQVYNDHHFTYGYFVYASALYSMFDPSFATASQYKGIVDILVRDYASDDRNDTSFPYLRGFDAYEGHSWTNGRGGADDRGIDQESSSEAMNSWAAIYLWGVASNNQDLINLGIYGYATEAASVKEYYFDADRTNYSATPWNHAAAGMLMDNFLNYGLWWGVGNPPIQFSQIILGIQIVPTAPAMLYLGYSPSNARAVYEDMWNKRNTSYLNIYRDLWLKFKALYDGAGALNDWKSTPNITSTIDEGNSATASFSFISFFNTYGQVNTDYYAQADIPFNVFKKTSGSNPYTFVVYNNDPSSVQKVQFSGRSGKQTPESGIAFVPQKTILTTSDFISFKFTPMDNSTKVFPYTSSNGKMSAFVVGSTMAFYTPTPAVTFNETNLPIQNSTYAYVGGSAFVLTNSVNVSTPISVQMYVRYSPSSFPNFVADESLLRLAIVDDNGNVTLVNNDAPDSQAHAFTAVPITNASFGQRYVIIYPLNAPREITVYAYPNPYTPSKYGSMGIHFTNLNANAQVSIYDIAGEKVFDTNTSSSGEYIWDAKNNSGSNVASGVYIYYIKSGSKVIKGKIAIER